MFIKFKIKYERKHFQYIILLIWRVNGEGTADDQNNQKQLAKFNAGDFLMNNVIC